MVLSFVPSKDQSLYGRNGLRKLKDYLDNLESTEKPGHGLLLF